MQCPFCKKENTRVSLTCIYCGRGLQAIQQNNPPISQEKMQEVKTRRRANDNAAKAGCGFASIIVFGILILIFHMGYTFLTIGLGEQPLEKKNITNYGETTGTLVNYKNCILSAQKKEKCKAIYEYEVDGNKYTATTTISKEKEKYEKTVKIKYNKDNHEENIIKIKITSYILIGGIIAGSAIVVAIVLVFAEIKFFRNMRMAEKSNK